MRSFKEIERLQARRALASVLLLLAASCYWSRYEEVMEVHLQVLSQYGAKLEALARDGRRVPVQDWGEFIYPEERARDFARIAAKRYPDRRSLALFRQVVERYAELVADADVLDRPDAFAEVARRVRALERAVAATRLALAREGRGERAASAGAEEGRAGGRAVAAAG